MTKFNLLPFYKQVTRVYILCLVVSLIFSPLFDKLYVWIFKPAMFGGDLYFTVPDFIETIINGALFAFYLFLPFFVFWLIKKKQWLIWFIGVAFPLSIAVIGGGLKETFWALILTITGWLLAQAVLLIKAKK